MMPKYVIIIITTTFIALFLILMLFSFFVLANKKAKEYVRRTSKKLKRLSYLNEAYPFFTISPVLLITKRINRKDDYNAFSLHDYLFKVVKTNSSYLDYKAKITLNLRLYNDYVKELGIVAEDKNNPNKLLISNSKYQKIENELFEKMIKKAPAFSFKLCLKKVYDTPKGKKHYENKVLFIYDDILLVESRIKEKEENKAYYTTLKNLERMLVTPKLRYEVLKRDNFKCKICGYGANDNVKLHVDHIIPIAKGGKTVYDNLQTLCETCNIGKSDSI